MLMQLGCLYIQRTPYQNNIPGILCYSTGFISPKKLKIICDQEQGRQQFATITFYLTLIVVCSKKGYGFFRLGKA